MSDFSLTTLFVAPSAQAALPTTGSTNTLTPGQIGIFSNTYAPLDTTVATTPYFYIAQGRQTPFMQGSKRSDKISGKASNVTEWYKVVGSAVALNQITEISNLNIKCGEDVSITVRGFSNYLDALYNYGFTKSVTVQAPCCDCGVDPCDTVDAEALIDKLILKLNQTPVAVGPNSIFLSKFYTFTKTGTGLATKLIITGKPLDKYANPCDLSAFPYEYDRLRFNVFVYKGADTSADFLVSDACRTIATVATTQQSTYPKGLAREIQQLETQYYSFQAGFMKHLYRMVGYNQNFESYVTPGAVYDTYYIKFNDYEASSQNWSDYVSEDSIVIVAAISGSPFATQLEAVLETGLGVI